MDDELKKFLDGEEDWKFQERTYNLAEHISPLICKKILDKFYFEIKDGNQSNIRVIMRSESKPLKVLIYNSKIKPSNLRIISENYLKIKEKKSQKIIKL